MGLFKKNENEKKNKNEKFLDLNTEKTLSDEDLDKVAGGKNGERVGIVALTRGQKKQHHVFICFTDALSRFDPRHAVHINIQQHGSEAVSGVITQQRFPAFIFGADKVDPPQLRIFFQ